jgi:signal transduction histidine kinase
MAIVLTAARELTGADGVTFVMRENGQCHYVDEDAIAPLWKGSRFPMSACVSGWVMVHGESIAIPDVDADHRVPADAYDATFVKSLAMVPVRRPDPIGAIGAYWSTRHHASEEELALMTMLADCASLALLNVQLHAETHAAVEREREARQAAERAQCEAEQATAAKDELLALVAHELRQPLHASLAAVRMQTAYKNQPEAAERARTVVERQIQAMTAIVEDLLDAAQIVRGNIALDLQPVDIRELLQRVAETVETMMVERHHDFSLALADAPVMVNIDTARLQQVLMNLLDNAAKYTERGGIIRLTMIRTDFDVTISVRDNGHGIDPTVLPRIFELFRRGARKANGFGIGLAVAPRLVELHGGTLEARSEGIGRGSEFLVRLMTIPVTVDGAA